MLRRVCGLLLLLLFFPVLSMARVLSYAPYTDQTPMRGYHLRTTRHFVLAEGARVNVALDEAMDSRVVLYDASGVEEPRVIFPSNPEETANIRATALFQSSPDRDPVILVHTVDPYVAVLPPAPTRATHLSTDGGRTWKQLPELDGRTMTIYFERDSGGPYTRGLSVPVGIGTAQVPFVVAYEDGLYAISANGAVRPLFQSTTLNSSLLVGQNQAGTHFLLRHGLTSLSVVDAATGATTPVANNLDPQSGFSGWISGTGDIYLHGRSGLWLIRGAQATLIAPFVASGTAMQFAVPAHDFDGAWILQRERTKPTTLLRYKPAGGLQTMWSDVSGPEVEALHVSASGERLLIQVHRNRPVQQLVFIDPALAIWKVGDPAPRAYDELFLNEGRTKGFVHLDVDAVAGGAPFVFDSANIEEPTEVISPPVSGGGDVIQEWGVVRASLRQQLVLPGVARLPGAFSSYWLTDLVIYNPLDAKQDVDIRFVPMGQDISIAASAVTRLTLEAREIRVVTDALQSLFGVETGGGALHFMPAEGMNVTGRTYSKAGPGSGTFGYGALAIDIFNAAGPRFPLSFAGAFPGPSFRTNILLTDTSGRGAEGQLQAFGVGGAMGSDAVRVATPTHGVIQANGVSTMLGLAPHQSGGLVVQPTRGTIIPTVVAIDNRTNDPTYFPPDLPTSIIRAIPAIGHLDGAHGSRFRSDLFLLNLSPTVQQVTLEVKKWDTADAPRSITFSLLPNEARVIEDALFRLFNLEGIARLRYWTFGPDSRGVRVTSRTYNIDANGGTFGCLIPPLNSFQSVTAGEALEIVGIVGGTGFRTNIGLVDLTPVSNGRTVGVRLFIFDDRGRQIDSFTVTLPAAGGMQINDIFAARGITPPPAARVVVQVLDAIGLVGAYATLTDNITNDSTYLGAQLAATPQ